MILAGEFPIACIVLTSAHVCLYACAELIGRLCHTAKLSLEKCVYQQLNYTQFPRALSRKYGRGGGGGGESLGRVGVKYSE